MKYWLTVTAPCDMVSNTTPDIWFNASSQLFNLNHCVHSNVGYDQPVTDRHHYHTRPEALVAQQGLQRLVTKAATSIQINNSWCCAVVGFLVFLLCLYPRAKKSVYIIKNKYVHITYYHMWIYSTSNIKIYCLPCPCFSCRGGLVQKAMFDSNKGGVNVSHWCVYKHVI